MRRRRWPTPLISAVSRFLSRAPANIRISTAAPSRRASPSRTLAPDELSANIKFAPDEQALKCAVAPDAFSALDNAWGRQGWTRATLAALSEAELGRRWKWLGAMAQRGRKRATSDGDRITRDCADLRLGILGGGITNTGSAPVQFRLNTLSSEDQAKMQKLMQTKGALPSPSRSDSTKYDITGVVDG